MTKKFLIFCFLPFFLSACDYVTDLEGKIIDIETGKPISGATVNLLDGKDIQETNADGFFSVSFCPTRLTYPKVLITKKGYKPFEIEFDGSDKQKIYKVTTETKYVKLSKPFYFIPNDTSSYMVNVNIDKWSRNFSVGDTLKIYLKPDNENLEVKQELEKIKRNWATQNNNNSN